MPSQWCRGSAKACGSEDSGKVCGSGASTPERNDSSCSSWCISQLTFCCKQNAAPLTIGLAVVAGIFAEGPFSGGSMNPARSFGAAFAFWKFSHVLIYIIATMCGGIAAGMCYDKLYLEDVQPAEIEDRDEGEYEGA